MKTGLENQHYLQQQQFQDVIAVEKPRLKVQHSQSDLLIPKNAHRNQHQQARCACAKKFFKLAENPNAEQL